MSCDNFACECKNMRQEERQTLQESLSVYLSAQEIPERVKKPARLLRVLVSDFASGQAKSCFLQIILAEIQFYFFGNFCRALEILAQIEVSRPGMLFRQRMYNLQRTIRAGFLARETRVQDPQQIVSSLAYLKHYHRFLDQIDDSTELTIKFWSVLLHNDADTVRLDLLGKRLFASKYEFMKTVDKVLRISSNHIEFLVRYGLFMQLVMHDAISAEQAFDKIMTINSTLTGGTTCGFSLFREDVAVMMVIARVEAAAVTVCEINTALEQTLGYSRKDLVDFSVNHIMPPEIAQCHQQLVQNYFQTLKTHNVNAPREHMVKAKSGLYVPCHTLLKVVPELAADGRLRFALLMTENRRLVPYTSFRRDRTRNKVISSFFTKNRPARYCATMPKSSRGSPRRRSRRSASTRAR